LQLVRYVPEGSLCTASAEQILPRDGVQRNCFELALYTTRDHDCISNRIGSGIRNIRDADVGSLRSVRSQRRRRYIARSSCRTIIGSGDMLLAPHHHQLRRSHRSIHCWHGHAARRSALPRERFSPMTRSSYAGASYSCRSRENQKLQWPAPPASVCSQTSRTASR
jgi:hypothetical protein